MPDYIEEFAGRNNVRRLPARRQMRFLAVALEGKSLPWKESVDGAWRGSQAECPL